MKTMRITVLLLFMICCLAGCQKEDNSPLGRYRSAVEAGLTADTGPRETVLGIDLGMTYQEFYDHCMQLNGQQIVTMEQEETRWTIIWRTTWTGRQRSRFVRS